MLLHPISGQARLQIRWGGEWSGESAHSLWTRLDSPAGPPEKCSLLHPPTLSATLLDARHHHAGRRAQSTYRGGGRDRQCAPRLLAHYYFFRQADRPSGARGSGSGTSAPGPQKVPKPFGPLCFRPKQRTSSFAIFL